MNKLLIFDLDGTLVDSAGGIARSVNRTREKFGYPPLDEALITSYTGNGAAKLWERSSADIQLDIPPAEAVALMTELYAADPLFNTVLYDGVAAGLAELKNAGFLLAVLSNKPQLVSEKILSGLGIAELLCANLGGGSGFPLKPEPDAVFYLLEKFSADKAVSFVVGDNYTDLAVAENAGMQSIFCRYGIGKKLNFTAEKEVDSFAELTAFLTALPK